MWWLPSVFVNLYDSKGYRKVIYSPQVVINYEEMGRKTVKMEIKEVTYEETGLLPYSTFTK